MDPRLVFWTSALGLMAVIVALAATGVRRRRRGDLRGHRRAMLAASALVGVFIVAYLGKVALLGRELLSEWSPEARLLLRVHELCIAVMLAGGALAGTLARRLRRSRAATLDPRDPPAPAALARWHRRAGWAAVVAAATGWFTALWVLIGMFQRARLG